MKRNLSHNYAPWAIVISIAACVVASWSRLVGHELWQDIVILLSGAVIGIFGLLLALNWRGIADRYSASGRRLSPKQPPRRRQQFMVMRVSGALLTLEALAAIISSILWIMALFNNSG